MATSMTLSQRLHFNALKVQAEDNAKNPETAVVAYAPAYNYLIECFAPAVSAIISSANYSPPAERLGYAALLGGAIDLLDNYVENSVIRLFGYSVIWSLWREYWRGFVFLGNSRVQLPERELNAIEQVPTNKIVATTVSKLELA